MRFIQTVPRVGISTKLQSLMNHPERNLRGPRTTIRHPREGTWRHGNTLAGFDGTKPLVVWSWLKSRTRH
jgi:hypothetical protein